VQQFDLHEASGELKSIMKLLEARNYEKALANLEKILKKKPDLGAAHYLKGQTLLRMERYGEAVAEYRRTLELDKEQPGVPGNLALAMLRHGEELAESGDKEAAEALYENSVAMFDMALKEEPAGMALLTSRAAALERLGDQERIVAALSGILEVDSENVQVRLRLADILIKDGQAAEAAKVLDELVSEELSVANTLFNLAVHFYNEGQLEPAVVAVEKAIKINPELAAGYRLLGRARMSQGDQEGAVQALEKFLELAPDDPSADTERNLIKALQAG
jgi:tetratricopeptide (TPR) repeat protein